MHTSRHFDTKSTCYFGYRVTIGSSTGHVTSHVTCCVTYKAILWGLSYNFKPNFPADHLMARFHVIRNIIPFLLAIRNINNSLPVSNQITSAESMMVYELPATPGLWGTYKLTGHSACRRFKASTTQRKS